MKKAKLIAKCYRANARSVFEEAQKSLIGRRGCCSHLITYTGWPDRYDNGLLAVASFARVMGKTPYGLNYWFGNPCFSENQFTRQIAFLLAAEFVLTDGQYVGISDAAD